MERASHQLRRALSLLIESLEARQGDGLRTVWLTQQARKDLKALLQPRQSAPGERPRRETPPSPRPAPAAAPTPRVREDHQPVAEAAPVLRPEGATPEEQLAWLRDRVADWPAVRQLGSLRPTMVFAVGNPCADLMLVGEAPGAEEERRGEPFVGRAGETLTRILETMGLKRHEVYITNIVKFRPAMKDEGKPQGTANREPTAEEMAACLPFVHAEIEVVRPRVIVALGGTAARGLLGTVEPVARLRGRFREFRGVPLMVTYHPSYLLRHEDPIREKRKVWEDMLQVMEKLGMPISAKQRGFFLSR